MSRSIHWAEIDRLVLAHHRENPTSSLEALERYLRKWWCVTYERPFKDPLLEAYTLDELAYEFLTKYYLKPENDPDKIEEAKQVNQEDDEWAARMVQKEIGKIAESAQNMAASIKDSAKKLKKTRKSAKKSEPQPVNPADFPDVISTKFDVPEPGDNKP